MNAETIKVRLIGDRPLLMHAGRLADPLDEIAGDLAKITCKRNKTQADHEEIARVEWHGARRFIEQTTSVGLPIVSGGSDPMPDFSLWRHL